MSGGDIIETTGKGIYETLATKGSKYTADQKLEVVTTFMITGNYTKTAELCDVPLMTIRQWKDTEWWQEVLRECRQRKQDELDATLTGTIHSIVEKVTERVEKGDIHVDKFGNEKVVPIKGRDLAIILNSFFDKRALLRGDPTANTKTVTGDDRLKELEKKFLNMANQLDAKTIEGEHTTVEDDEGDSHRTSRVGST